MSSTRRLVVNLLVFTLAGASALLAEDSLPGRLVRLEVLTPSGQVAQGLIREGEVFELGGLSSGTRVGFSPSVAGGTVSVKVLALNRSKEGDSLLLEELSLGVGESQTSEKTSRPYRVKIVAAEGLAGAGELEAEEASFAPISTRFVRLEVTLPDRTVATGMVQEGQIFRVTSGADAVSYGFSPNLQGTAPVIRVYRIHRHAMGGNEMIELLEALTTSAGDSALLESLGGRFEVKVVEVREQV